MTGILSLIGLHGLKAPTGIHQRLFEQASGNARKGAMAPVYGTAPGSAITVAGRIPAKTPEASSTCHVPGQHADVEAIACAWLEEARRQIPDGRSGSRDAADAAAGWETAVRLARVAARVMSSQSRRLSWPALEALLREAALQLEPMAEPLSVPAAQGSPTCLHVLTHARAGDDVVARVARWVWNDTTHPLHSVALLSPEETLPAELREAVAARGGQVFTASEDSSWLQRARWLRHLAREGVRTVVLHGDADDVLSATALDTPGSPPLVRVPPHARRFWTGSGAADLVIDERGGAREGVWCTVHRGARRVATVPVPLTLPQQLQQALAAARHGPGEPAGREGPSPGAAAFRRDPAGRRRDLCRMLGLPVDAQVLATWGRASDYQPLPGLDFLSLQERVLHAAPRAFLIAAGFEPGERWRQAQARTGGRLRAVGPVDANRWALLLEVADLYLDPFAPGRPPTLLSAGLAGVPALLAPAVCPPPYGTDGVAVDGVLPRAADEAAYLRLAAALLQSRDLRRALGLRLQAAVTAHHTGAGWQRHLPQAMAKLPARHRLPTTPASCVATAPWAQALESQLLAGEGLASSAALSRSLEDALTLGLAPRMALKAIRASQHTNADGRWAPGDVPPVVTRLMFGGVLPALPAGLRLAAWREVQKAFAKHRGAPHTPGSPAGERPPVQGMRAHTWPLGALPTEVFRSATVPGGAPHRVP